MNKSQNLQDNFLNQVRKDSIPVTIYLVSGVQLKGHVRGFDSFTVLLESPGKPTQLVYKHAMASVVPARFVSTAPPREEFREEPREEPRVEPREEPSEEPKEEQVKEEKTKEEKPKEGKPKAEEPKEEELKEEEPEAQAEE